MYQLGCFLLRLPAVSEHAWTKNSIRPCARVHVSLTKAKAFFGGRHRLDGLSKKGYGRIHNGIYLTSIVCLK